jgi:3-dehydroquinate synthase
VLSIRHAGGRYPVHIGAGRFASLSALVTAFGPARTAVISDATVAALHPAPLPHALSLTFPAGESHKTREEWTRLTDALLSAGLGRDALVVAVGGGVTTDLGGFVAATYLRGIPWIAVPTTTLAMLDAAVGGKTGVDTALGKNLVGAFHPPVAVIADPVLLTTLPERTYREGLAEAVKHAAITGDAEMAWLTEHATAILAREPATVSALVERNVAIKAAVVSDDEREGGRRAVLNAGHTVAHALEHAHGLALAHGEAVAIGLVLEARAGEQLGITAPGTADQLAALLQQLGLPTSPPQDTDRLVAREALARDKKNRGGQVRATMLARIGQVARDGTQWTVAVEAEALV